ncbi:sugar transferase [Pseudemcibacter aquimaris]|uniref:sugar transferase n=1 Tax=Pseudemcibacter aquimaris TaxID=2857064 RepID=UPI0020127C48|nr:sugar transferase [Pseudemcibacter aquimaris]MCC3861730.1 sugar transferase [Pseudemcibacter aquimaris]WDU58499.1 sugar transferase [Pseudemcibacter aquimaris]
MLKRLFDIVFSLLALIILLPVFIPIILILRFTGEGEVFYCQERMGKGNKPFKITKFATMLKNSPNMGTGGITLRDDPRVLPLGKFLRKTKINELPQFWDILIGNMSFVGPRPQMVSIHEHYPKEYEEVLNKVTPGVTGVGSIIFRDEEGILTKAKDADHTFKNEVIPAKVDLEKWYVENHSFLKDILLIMITAWVIISPRSNLLYKVFPKIPNIDTSKMGQ